MSYRAKRVQYKQTEPEWRRIAGLIEREWSYSEIDAHVEAMRVMKVWKVIDNWTLRKCFEAL